MDYKLVLGITAAIIGFIGYIPYFRDMYLGKTKPHAFSWLLWGVLFAIGFFAQISAGAGSGAYVLGLAALVSFFITVYALFKGKKDFVLFDWICLFFAVLTIIVWILTNNAFIAIAFITLIGFVAFLPTFRKSYHDPYSETISFYVLSVLKYILSLFAMQTISLTTMLYNSYIIVINLIFVLMVVARRKQLGKKNKQVKSRA